eukprot:CAMPEP_0197025250 /NCGR_PEP_ID=MMETSP1384-20130603/5648_1 /TAXON_ID=29189 /ORGANISM="Ammonia sp." /LENGTH=184 /DNA_ID=CAMNT_0042453763 /DNA_START=46 /DNA_END=600 /DNA_ORIENTATION=-
MAEIAAKPAKTVNNKKNKQKKKKSKKAKQNLPPGYKRLQKELQQLILSPPVGISAKPITMDNLMEWIAIIDGPENTPYHGGRFHLNIKFGENYPFICPKIVFKTKIYHCNINGKGDICLNVLKDGYSAALTVEKLLLSILALLQCPNPEDPLVGDIAQEYIVDKEAHDKTAVEWTKRYAMDFKK